MKVTLYFDKGEPSKIEHEVPDNIHKLYGIRNNACCRPTKVVIEGNPTDEFVYKSCKHLMHPVRNELVLNGETLWKNQ